MKINVSKKFMNELNNDDKSYKIDKMVKYQKILKKILCFELTFLLVATPTVFVSKLKSSYINYIEQNSTIYSEQLKENDEYIKNYSDEVKKLNLSDLEIIMKVMKDIWAEIDGYGVAKDLPIGYYRLAFQEEDRGVCTSFADDFTARMNAINPEYNARNIIVYCDVYETKGLQICDIETNVIESPSDNSDSVFGAIEAYIITNLVGNHMVSLIDIPNSDLTLMVDSTNLFIGIFRNGKIHVLNNNNDKLLDYKFISNYACSEDDFSDYCSDYFSEFGISNQSIDELNLQYGYEAQKSALEYVKKIETK